MWNDVARTWDELTELKDEVAATNELVRQRESE
jgi:hypothetical protein